MSDQAVSLEKLLMTRPPFSYSNALFECFIQQLHVAAYQLSLHIWYMSIYQDDLEINAWLPSSEKKPFKSFFYSQLHFILVIQAIYCPVGESGTPLAL